MVFIILLNKAKTEPKKNYFTIISEAKEEI